MSDGLHQVLAALGDHGLKKSGLSWMSRCPAHEDSTASLSVSEGKDQPVVVHCHAGCQPEDILRAIGLTWAEVSTDRPTPTDRPEILSTYDYVDEAGDMLFQVVRMTPKGFRQRRPDDKGGWIWKLDDTRRPLYRLPEVLEAVELGDPIFVVEGEKDADALRSEGYVATCNSGGAGKWLQEHTDTLAGAADVVVIADKDRTGRTHGAAVAAALAAVGATVRCAEARQGKDPADHLAAGLTVDEFDLIEDRWDSVLFAEPSDPGPADVASEFPDTDLDASLDPIDLVPILNGSHEQPQPDMLLRDDGASLLYPGAINGVHGDSGAGKGWVVCFAIRENIRRAKRTLLLDFEDTAHSIVARLIGLGLTEDEIIRGLLYVRPQVALGPAAVAHFTRIITDRNVDLVVIDSVGEAFALEAIDENKDVEVGPWYRRVARPLADTGATLLLVDHSTKAADNPLHPSGSKRKRAAITGASYLAEAVESFVKGRGGRLRLTCAKDRHGNYRKGEVVADLVMNSSEFSVRLDMYAPTIREASEAGVEVILAAHAAVRAAKAEGRPLSRSALEGLMKMKARNDIKRGGIDLAVSRGSLTEELGKRNAKLYTFVQDMDDGAGDKSVEPDAPPPDDQLFEGAA